MPYWTFLPTPYFLKPRVLSQLSGLSHWSVSFYLCLKPADWVCNSFQKPPLFSIKAEGTRSRGGAASSPPCSAKKAFTPNAVAPFLHIAAAIKSSGGLRQTRASASVRIVKAITSEAEETRAGRSQGQQGRADFERLGAVSLGRCGMSQTCPGPHSVTPWLKTSQCQAPYTIVLLIPCGNIYYSKQHKLTAMQEETKDFEERGLGQQCPGSLSSQRRPRQHQPNAKAPWLAVRPLPWAQRLGLCQLRGELRHQPEAPISNQIPTVMPSPRGTSVWMTPTVTAPKSLSSLSIPSAWRRSSGRMNPD